MEGLMFRGVLTFFLSIAVCCALPKFACAEQPSQDVAVQRAVDYVELLDQGNSEACWKEMTPLFKAISDKELWTRRQNAFREAYGPLLSRSFVRIDFRERYTRSPDGNYVIVQLRSSFQHKASVVETVVLDCSGQTECLVREYQTN